MLFFALTNEALAIYRKANLTSVGSLGRKSGSV